MALINISFKDLSDENLLVKAGQIESNMTGNVNFPDPDPGLDELGTCKEEYSEALDNLGKGTGSTLVKDAKRKKLEKVLRNLGLYIERIADGDEIIAETSGFTLSAKRDRVGILEKGSNLKAVPGPGKGSVKLSVNKIHGAKTYLFEYKLSSDMTNDNWKVVVASQKTVIINGLISGQEYTFRVAGAGANPTRVYSDEIRSFVL
ncbi:MAG: fibronectin type III domain-containing protein [Daejeonella sp.]